ncbi:MAG: hypothetical protein ABEJ43_02795, partial [Haloferacaceae archaeon]
DAITSIFRVPVTRSLVTRDRDADVAFGRGAPRFTAGCGVSGRFRAPGPLSEGFDPLARTAGLFSRHPAVEPPCDAALLSPT